MSTSSAKEGHARASNPCERKPSTAPAMSNSSSSQLPQVSAEDNAVAAKGPDKQLQKKSLSNEGLKELSSWIQEDAIQGPPYAMVAELASATASHSISTLQAGGVPKQDKASRDCHAPFAPYNPTSNARINTRSSTTRSRNVENRANTSSPETHSSGSVAATAGSER